MLETSIDTLVAALNANTLAHGGKPPGAVAAKPGTVAAKPPAASKLTMEMVKAAVIGVKDAFDKPTALALIKKHAKANEIASIKPTFFQAVIDACAEKMAEGEGTEEAAADDDDEL